MKYLKIQNAGELDVRLVSLMGGTTKNGSRSNLYTREILQKNEVQL